ncbi:Cytochrome P450, E-class, group I [Trema orientale]|uniref:Cytochrome P450, E-class, group I n=1 Tax=Trema orientale TaxID=63057 RepID=A0A2P5AIM4_TREOI|nr:Cytochrome P450, E-class, group I [Trema orientale]
MYFIAVIGITLLLAFILSKLFSNGQAKNLPGGSLGYPLIGETLSFLRAQKDDRGPQWLEERISKYGPVFKTSLMGSPTLVITGQTGNKFVLGAEDDIFAAKQPITLQAIGGKQNIFELTGSRYRLIKGAMLSFLKAESLQNYIERMDELVKNILSREIKEGRGTIKAVTTMKKITFNLACELIFGIEDKETKEALLDDFSIAFKAVWSIPVKFPGTTYWKGLRARSRIVERVLPILRKRKEELSEGELKPENDILSCLLALRDENHEPISDDTIMDNYVTLMVASHDTSAILMSLTIWKLSRDPEIYHKVLEEHKEIMRRREGKEDQKLTWGEIQKMKYTWRVAQELMRMIPPVFGSFRKALKDTSYGGYDIPKGWQVFSVAWGTHMNKDVFENPTEFDPSRFENPSKPITPYAYVPFGGGLHTCIGNEFARVETLVTIHNLVTFYEWSQLNPEEVITRQPMPYPSLGLPIKINPRNQFSYKSS